jgi:hypothetical protein
MTTKKQQQQPEEDVTHSVLKDREATTIGLSDALVKFFKFDPVEAKKHANELLDKLEKSE